MTLRKGSLTYDVNSAWPGRPEPPGDVGKRFLRTLELLEPLHPTFHDWYTVAAAPVDWEDPAEYPLPTIDVAALGPDLSPWVVANVRRDDFTRPDPELRVPARREQPRPVEQEQRRRLGRRFLRRREVG